MLNPTDPLINLAKAITLLPDYLIKDEKLLQKLKLMKKNKGTK